MYKGMQGLTFSYATTELSNQWEMSGSRVFCSSVGRPVKQANVGTRSPMKAGRTNRAKVRGHRGCRVT